jgi:hypothetical protein
MEKAKRSIVLSFSPGVNDKTILLWMKGIKIFYCLTWRNSSKHSLGTSLPPAELAKESNRQNKMGHIVVASCESQIWINIKLFFNL